MGYRLENGIRKEKKVKKKNNIKKVIIAVAVMVAIGGPITWKVYYEYQHNIGQSVTNWSNVNYDLDFEETDSVPGEVTQGSYYKVRGADSLKTIQKLKKVIPEKFYNNLTKGLESKYYKDVTDAEYYDTTKEIKDLMAQSEYILKMYDSYSSNKGFKDIDYCNTEPCTLNDFIEAYTGNELQKYLLDVHQKWESLVAYYATTVEISDETINMFYEEELATNIKYIESIEVRAYTLNSKLSKMIDESLIEELKDTNDIPYVDLTIKDKEGLELLSLYRSNKFYTPEIAALLPNTMISVTGGSTDSSVVNLTGEKDIDTAIKNIEAPTNKQEGSGIKDLPYISFSLTEKSEDDIITVYYDIRSIKHIKDMPTLKELSKELEKKARIFTAENALSENLDTMITDDVGESREVTEGTEGTETTEDTEDHDHDGDGVQDHIYKQENDEWWVLDDEGNYVPQIDEGHDHDGDGVQDH